MNPVGILLAAGRGSRFDPSGAANKLLAPLPDGEPVVAASARHLLEVLPRVVAVCAAEGEVARLLRTLGCEVTICPDAAQGMGASLAHAIRHSLPASAWMVALGDMPFVQPPTIRALCDALANGARIAAPVSRGRRGNPVGFGSDHLAALLALQGDEGARHLVRSHDATLVEVTDPGIFADIDSPADL
ncbi:MAG: nucleotidyltransferase family protein [Telluria sp.]